MITSTKEKSSVTALTLTVAVTTACNNIVNKNNKDNMKQNC